MNIYEFTPKNLAHLEPILELATDTFPPGVAIELAENICNFVNSVTNGNANSELWFQQIEWMWRWCYKKLSWNSGFLLWKWTWPWAGSEVMRIHLDSLHRSWAREEWKQWWCIRVPMSKVWPFLVQYHVSDTWVVEIIDPRPEWFSIFWATYREYLAGQVYSNLWIKIVKPLQLFRENTPAPWSWDKEKFQDALSREVMCVLHNGNIRALDCLITKDSYHDLDAGILFRYAETPYRISNLFDFCVKNDLGSLRWAINTLASVWPETNAVLTEEDIFALQIRVTKTIAKNAALMFVNGIIHGQFRRHFQNISALGELSDFDSTVFLWISDKKRDIWFDIPLVAIRESEQFLHLLQKGEREHKVDMIPFLKSDEVLFFGERWNKPHLVTNMMWQVYDLFNQSMRINDIFWRYMGPKIDHWWCSLDPQRYDELVAIFTTEFKHYTTPDHQNFIRNTFVPNMDIFHNMYLNRDRGDISIYGWKIHPQLDYLSHNIQAHHLDNAAEEAKKIFRFLS